MRKLCRVLMALPLLNLSINLCLAQSTHTSFEPSKVEQVQFKHFNDSQVGDNYYLLITFEEIPDKSEINQLQQKGIQLLEYRSKKTYLAAIPNNIDPVELRSLQISVVKQPKKAEKLENRLLRGDYPDWIVDASGKLDIAVLFHDHTDLAQINNLLSNAGAEILEDKHRGNKTYVIRISENKLDDLVNSPLVSFVDVKQEPVGVLNHEVKVNQKVNILNSSLTDGYGLLGNGVTVGVGDGGELGEHIDFGNRIINEANGTYSSFGDHGDHVSGTIGGGGLIDPRHRGMAPECTIVTQKTSQITYNTEEYHNEYGMVLTNNSYGTTFNCNTNGSYNYSAQTLDWQLREYPKVLHIFAAGNSGGGTCDPYPTGYRTVLRYYQSAKNVLTVGMAEETRVLATSSSRGPVKDGRIKPEIIGIGRNVVSTSRDYNYSTKGGTSMSAPAVTGTLALLVEKYRQENNGEDPDGALLKAIACNTADDLGNPGPDYNHGFGLINARRAVEVLTLNQYKSDEISDGETKVQAINIPQGVEQAKIMLYWHDKEAAIYPEKALVNDLNVYILTPSGETIRPWVLDPTPTAVANNASRGIDTLNNIEQVTIEFPEAGTYTIVVEGEEVPFGPQKYFTTYELVKDEVVITHPVGGESFKPGSNEYITWDTDQTNTASFKLEYSIDGGNNWLEITPAVDANQRSYKWTVPEVYTPDAMVRVSKNGAFISDENEVFFNIMNTPGELIATPTCEEKIILSWESCEYTTEYEVMMFNGENMVQIGSTEGTMFLVEEPLAVGTDYWFSVRAVGFEGSISQRVFAIAAIPEDIEICPWDDNPVVEAVGAQLLGRDETSKELTDDETVAILVKNIGINDIETFEMFYSVNGGEPVQETFNGLIESGGSLMIDFATKADLSQVGIHHLDTWVEITGNNSYYSDSLIGSVYAQQLLNAPVLLPYSETFQSANTTTYNESTLGLEGNARWDFEFNGSGQMEVFQGEAMILRPIVAANGMPIDNNAILTLNMFHYKDMDQEVELSFDYQIDQTTTQPVAEPYKNKVFVRGSDTDEWVLAYEMKEKTEDWEEVKNLNIYDLLVENNQVFTSSFQIKFNNDNNYPISVSNIVVDKWTAPTGEEAFVDFTAEQIGGDVVLTWTPIELEEIFFEIEVIENYSGEDDDEFDVIGTVRAVSTTTQPYYYTFVDLEPSKRGWRFYRIKQIGQDGEIIYSPVLSVLLNGEELDGVFPNPFYNQVNLAYNAEKENVINILITDQNGRLISNDQREVNAGKQSIPVRFNEHLPAGLYLLKVIDGTKTTCHKLIKQK